MSYMTKDGAIWAVMLSVGAGAFLGAMTRWLITYLLNDKPWFIHAPMGTLIVNLMAGYLMGIVLSWLTFHPFVSAYVRLFLITGFLGAFSTISAVVGENYNFVLHGQYLWAIIHYLLHVGGCYLMMIAGYWTMHARW